jgi:hypothetical protein
MSEVIELPTRAQLDEAMAEVSDPLLKNLTPEEVAIAQKILPAITVRANELAQANYTRSLEQTITSLKAENEKIIQAEIQKFRDGNKPLEPKDIQALLTQEYAEFSVKLSDRTGKAKDFVIRELPQAVELKMMKVLQKAIVPHLRELNAIEWNAGTSTTDKLQKLIDIVPEALDTLSDICVMALDPFGDESVTKEWVQRNMSSFRIIAVIEAQFMTSKVRDFFSAGSRLMNS